MPTGDSPPTRILVLWADRSAANLGLRALAVGTQNVAESVWGNVDLTFHSHNTVGTPLTRKAVLADIGRRKGPIKVLLSQFSVMMDTGGGDSFTDIYGLRRLLLQAYMHRAARKVGCPVVMTPQTIGPFGTKVGRMVGRRLLARANFAASRDPISDDYAVGLGRKPDVQCSDLVFSISAPTPSDVERDVLLNISGLLWNPNPHVDFAMYRRETYTLIEGLRRQGRSVTLLAHVLQSDSADNDVPAVLAVGKEYGDVEVLIPHGLDEVRAAIASSNVLIGARMHACLNSLSVGTPAVAWAYSRKFEPLLSTLGWTLCLDLRADRAAAATTLAMIGGADQCELEADTFRAKKVADEMAADLTSELRALLSTP